MFIRVRPAVECLDIFAVEGNRRCSVFDDLVPVSQSIVARGTVRVEYGIRLAQNSLAVKLDGFIVALITICLIASNLELGRVFLSLLLVLGTSVALQCRVEHT